MEGFVKQEQESIKLVPISGKTIVSKSTEFISAKLKGLLDVSHVEVVVLDEPAIGGVFFFRDNIEGIDEYFLLERINGIDRVRYFTTDGMPHIVMSDIFNVNLSDGSRGYFVLSKPMEGYEPNNLSI
jgi:hypothetical protein